MHLRLVIPGLFWPQPAHLPELDALPLDALAWLLARAQIEPGTAATPAAAFAEAAGLGSAGHAVLRRAGETGTDAPQAGENWLCADPVSLRFAREHLLLHSADSLGLDAAEAHELESVLRETLAPVGAFSLPDPQRGYLKLNQSTDASFSPLDDVAGRPVALFLPEGREAIRWGRIINETQVVLHDCPLNRARESAGAPLANSLWFWGAGTTPAKPQVAPDVLADSVLGLGAGRLAGGSGQAIEALAERLQDGQPPSHILIESLHRPALYRDPVAWCAALSRLETLLFAPIVQALRSGRIGSLSLDAPGEREGRRLLIRARRLAFWLKPRAPATVLTSPPIR